MKVIKLTHFDSEVSVYVVIDNAISWRRQLGAKFTEVNFPIPSDKGCMCVRVAETPEKIFELARASRSIDPPEIS